MSENASFRFTLPEKPPEDGTPVTAEQAEQLLLKQIETHQRPQDQVLWDLARLYHQTGRCTEAIARIKQLVAITGSAETKAQCCLAMGQSSEKLRDYEAAIRYYSEAMTLEPADSDTWYFIQNNLGYCLNHFGRFVEAEPYCRRAITTDPLRYNAHKNLGISLEGEGDYAGAATCYIKAVVMDAADGRALKRLEQLAENHPTVTIDVPEFEAQLRGCRMAVKEASEARDEVLKQWKQKPAPSGPPSS
jgi:tetratricopeptide (TPR) repeat protein